MAEELPGKGTEAGECRKALKDSRGVGTTYGSDDVSAAPGEQALAIKPPQITSCQNLLHGCWWPDSHRAVCDYSESGHGEMKCWGAAKPEPAAPVVVSCL